MNSAVIGCGYWGRHLIRNFYTSKNWTLKYICDIKQSNSEQIADLYPGVIATIDYNMILADRSIDAIIIATPVSTHFELAKKALLAGKHVWLEKPMTSSSLEAEELCKLAESKGVLLHVDHTFIYTPAVRKMKEIIDNKELGDILYFDSVRVNLGLFQHDVNVIWDLAPHDISIWEFCVGKKPVSVHAIGSMPYKYSENDIESIAYLTVKFEDGTIAHFHSNWLSPVKIRQIILGGSKKMLIFNDMEPMEKLKIYDTGVDIKTNEDVYETLVQYRTGDMHSPAIKNYEALSTECEHFCECIKAGKATDTDGYAGLYVVKILEAASESLKTGQTINLD
jgi:predicted dehydrogenase